MSVAAVLLAKDEADIVEYTVRWLLSQVDHVIVADNGSTDGTREILQRISEETPVERDPFTGQMRPAGCWILDDREVGYFQAKKTTRLAAEALSLGHKWVIPCDADEFWYATDGRTIRDFLAGLARDVAYVRADLFNHLPTSEDPPDGPWTRYEENPDGKEQEVPGEPNPFRRLGWRQREHGALPKVAARLRPNLEIRQGNHSAYAPGSGLTATGLCVRHFSWRSAEQYERKIRNGYRAYAATDLPADVGTHWRMFGDPDDPSFSDRVREHFSTWFFVDDPGADPSLIYDPAPDG